MKLSDKLDMLRAAVPKGPTRFGQLYAVASETRRKYRRVTLHTLFISEENTHLLRPHVFRKESALTPAQWSDWFGANLTRIHKDFVLPGIAIRTSKSWAVERIIGWSGGNVEYKSNPSAIRGKRNKAK